MSVILSRVASLAMCGVALGAHGLMPPPPGVVDSARQMDTAPIAASPVSDALIPIGYAGLDEGVCERDMARVRAAFAEVDKWPTRSVFKPTAIDAYPESVIAARMPSEAVSLYVMVDPAEVHKACVARSVLADQPLVGPQASVFVAMIPATQFSSEQRFMRAPWPTWADSKFQTPDGFEQPAPMTNHRWTLIATSDVGMKNVVGPALSRMGVPLLSMFEVARVSSSCWRMVTGPASGATSGTLVFPLWDGTGVMRDLARDPFADERNGPTSTHVRARGLAWAIHGRALLVLPEPKVTVAVEAASLPNRERVIVPEVLARAAVPIASFYESEGSTPLAADFELCVGQPEPGRVPYAVCVFSTASDQQLQELAARLAQIGRHQQASDVDRPASE